MKAEKDTAIEHVRQAIYQREHLSRWASDAELKAADLKIVNSKTKANEAVAHEALALQERNRLEDQVSVEKSKLNELAASEIRLKAEMQRKPFYDPELGLATAPTGVISQ
jgi:uncharacterized protein (DUF3084 family)